MGMAAQEAIRQLQSLMEEVDEPLRRTYENIHQGYPNETLVRFLKARDWNVPKTYEMLVDCLKWRIENEIDNILANPITPIESYRAVRDSQLLGLSGYSKEGLPVIAIGVGLSTYDKASVNKYVQSHIQMNEYRDRVVLPQATKKHGRYIGTCIKVLDMTGLRLSAMNQIKTQAILDAQELADNIGVDINIWATHNAASFSFFIIQADLDLAFCSEFEHNLDFYSSFSKNVLDHFCFSFY
ncbi:hypothetical protein ACJRO7_023870 [Eucalyptus globulus]|uniref:CRAL/TRIO N-terminal domain-containing protein n=1 Tax=Eucalyptus globulus TaxID=34317 RepID=A0ABD3K9C1_EUCGL